MVWSEPNRNMNDPNAGIVEDLKQRFLHLFGWSLLVDIILKPNWSAPIKAGKEEEYTVREEWVRFDSAKIASMHYVRCEGYKENLAWWGVPVYCKITNGIVPDPINKETATTHNDRMTSNATKKFIKSLWRTALPSLSIQQIVLIGVLGVGAILGMWWLGVF